MRYKEKSIFFVTIIMALVVIFFLKNYSNNQSSEFKLIESNANEVKEIGDIVVHIDGYVKCPGVYKLPEGSRVSDIIELSGGLLAQADVSSVNLAAILYDEDKVHIPMEGEEYLTEPNLYIRLNSASKEELMSLPGIGEVLAQNIIDYRDKNRFKKVEDLKNVSGIGEKLYERICDKVRP